LCASEWFAQPPPKLQRTHPVGATYPSSGLATPRDTVRPNQQEGRATSAPTPDVVSDLATSPRIASCAVYTETRWVNRRSTGCRDLVPVIWLPDPLVRAERERARALPTAPRPPALEPEAARARAPACAQQALPRFRSFWCPWPPIACAARTAGAVAWHDRGEPPPDRRARARNHQLRARAAPARRRPPLRPVALHRAGDQRVLAYTIAAEIGDINRFPTPRKLAGYSGLCPRVYQSGERDLRGPLSKQACATYAGRSSRQPPVPAQRRPPRALSAHQGTDRQAARRQGRPGRPRPPPRRGDLAHAHPRAAPRSQRRHRALAA
jgi:Transposase IS116/IS110/IS902 family